ncbi:lysoplasmalogenase [Nocardia sp. CDC159]|uniref:Lysoplasmalogenase n=1 Tax=Nocardia pulmonis TaxID=2951408 RepID=A0A9X2EAG7_9NOCA|nr:MULTISPECIES: lysoplasmalogenase [Nocardia]MCM6777312.1 lysoplasmalogenase [Nocardia pulmonis]MCM6790197.1 lysoplasmalogenase [Nocardia sp. CDC159]
MPRPLRAAYAGAAAVTVLGAVTGRDRLQWFSKPLLMPLLAADVRHGGRALAPADRALLLGALAAATVGDVLLIDPDDDRRLVAGASSFAVMQAGYAALWLRRGARPRVAVAAPRVAAWFGAAALLRVKAPNLVAPLAAYGATLGTAAVLASDPELAPAAKTVAGMNVPGRDARSRLGLGALLFTLSDGLIVLRRLFARSARSRRVTEGVILSTYAAAQYLLTDPRAHES